MQLTHTMNMLKLQYIYKIRKDMIIKLTELYNNDLLNDVVTNFDSVYSDYFE